MSGKSFAAFMAVLAVVALLTFGVFAQGEKALDVGEPAPVVDLPLLGGEDDGAPETASVEDYRGNWVLVNVWASWCIPCEDEAPDLVAFQKEHGRPGSAGDPGFTILGVNTQDGTDDALEFVAEYDLNYPSIRDGSGDYADDLGATGVPESVLLDPDGNVAYARTGQVDAELLDANVLPLIEGGGPGSAEAGS